ncbi:insulinase family protein, partial [Candidatus Gottesmanbacteria bacterium]|nr:insulinase family protein [Candidatus Gottesmanbacteria bacterium]
MPHVQSVTVLVLVGAGSRFENKRISGLSHFLEHMAFKGTKRRPTALEISSLIEGIGGEFNAYTSKDQTGFYIKAANKHLAVLVDVLSDMLLHSKFETVEIERERGVIIEEINLYEDTPSRKIGEIYEELLYGDTPLGRDIAGKKETISKIKREDFLDYIKGLYAPENTVVVVAGGISDFGLLALSKFSCEKRISDLIGKWLGDWENNATWHYDKMSDKQNKPAAKIVYKKTEQAHLALGVRGYNLFHPDRYGLAVLSTILGGGMSSRLFIQVRERRGLAYYVYSMAEHYADVGHLVSRAGVDLNKIEEAIKVILEEYWKMAETAITPRGCAGRHTRGVKSEELT